MEDGAASSSSSTPHPQQTSSASSSAPTTAKNDEADLLLTRKKEDFLFLSELGEGSYSTVYLASERSTGRRFAVKICFKQKIIREKKVQQIFRERDILRMLSTPEHSSPFIVRLYCTFQTEDSLYFVLTLAERKDLLSQLKAMGNRVGIEQCQFVMSQLWSALSHIHSLKVVHRDVKPENILLRRNGHILLSDFGCAKRLDVPEKAKEAEGEELVAPDGAEKKPKLKRRCSFVGTAQYVSPEVLNGQPVGPASDWWAFGVILFELLAARRPFSGESEYLLYQQILHLDFTFPEDFPSEEARELVQHLLRLAPSDRFGSEEMGGPLRIRQDPFFAGVDWARLAERESPLFHTEDEQKEEEEGEEALQN